MGLEILSKFADPYDRQARLYPILIAMLPILAIVTGVYGVAFKFDSAFFGLITSFGIFYLLSTIGREFGKRLEAPLYAKWGGKPSIQLLRHSNTVIDVVTKKRYHEFLEKHLGEKFPTLDEEIADPSAADEKYRAATQWLLGKTRDKKKFGLLFTENISFGFRRNCLGLKPIAMSIACLSLVWTLVVCDALTVDGFSGSALVSASIGIKVSLIISLAMSFIWMAFFTEKTARSAAFSYADMLLRTCDMLPKKR